ncbi:hypothetical protein PIROE2DRAFT_3528 [Piromyces sp. E2]|nr:hypothetical protein PIROE2DRAFT_3528 [Piromyces sp. E2]|eukprot:OUM68686.1 hypothetical protein PIROE2DRAFT_3528 [Piromyces sp. E2]
MFLNNNGKPVSLLDIVVYPQGYIVDRSFRFNKTENEILRKTIRFNVNSSPTSNLVEGFLKNNKKSSNHNRTNSSSQKKKSSKSKNDLNTTNDYNEKYVCSNLNEVASSISNVNAYTKEVSFKYKNMNSPNERVFYLFFYDDPYMISLNEIWRIFVHHVQR